MEIAVAAAIIIVIVLLLLFFAPQYLTSASNSVKSTTGISLPMSTSTPAPAPSAPPRAEHMSSRGASGLPEPVSDALYSMGYDGGVPWDEAIQATEVDPATFASQQKYVREVRRFSSGANFTSVADDDNNLAFVNFVGLQRPQHVPIGASARQQPDIDQSVLQRNKQLRF